MTGVISANTFRSRMGLAPAPPRKHKLVIWPDDVTWDRLMKFKCVKCSKGALTIERAAVRAVVSGETGWSTYFATVAWGSWQICREDLDEPLSPPTTPS